MRRCCAVAADSSDASHAMEAFTDSEVSVYLQDREAQGGQELCWWLVLGQLAAVMPGYAVSS
jgi:hypothetical protein